MSRDFGMSAGVEEEFGPSKRPVVEEEIVEPIPNQEEIQGICNSLNEAAKDRKYPDNQILFVPKEFVLRQVQVIDDLVQENKRYAILVQAYRNKDLDVVKDLVDTIPVGNSEIVIPGVNGPRLGDEHLSRDTPTEIMNAHIAHKKKRELGYLKK